MLGTKKNEKPGKRWLFNPPVTFPDSASCRVKRSNLDESFDCLNPWAWRCPHALQVADGYLCRHPANRELLVPTEAGSRG